MRKRAAPWREFLELRLHTQTENDIELTLLTRKCQQILIHSYEISSKFRTMIPDVFPRSSSIK